MTTALVVPSIREKNILEFLDNWKDIHWDEIIVVEDNPEKTFRLGSRVSHFSWAEIEFHMEDRSWIISHRDSAIRSFGFYYAHMIGHDYIYTLDDDCAPLDPFFCEKHLENLNTSTKWTYSVPGQRTRGFPYDDLGKNRNVMVSMGLWENVPDYAAIQELGGNNPKLVLPETSTLMPANQYFPFCGMNVCFRNEAAVLMYFPLQGEGYPYRRFDDIWCGVIMKKICDHLGWQVAVGPPHINHTKASNKFVNLEKEAPGIAFHDTFWKTVDSIKLEGDTAVECMRDIGWGLRKKSEVDSYLNNVGKAIVTWANLFAPTEDSRTVRQLSQ